MTDLFINYGLFLIFLWACLLLFLYYIHGGNASKEIVDFLSKRRNPRICPSTKCYTQIQTIICFVLFDVFFLGRKYSRIVAHP